jgi:hypothetical protein
MADDDHPISDAEGPNSYPLTLSASLQPRGGITEVRTSHRWIEWNWNFTLVLFALLFVPPLVTWWVAQFWTPLSGFLGVVVGWIAGALGTWIGYKAVTTKTLDQITNVSTPDE